MIKDKWIKTKEQMPSPNVPVYVSWFPSKPDIEPASHKEAFWRWKRELELEWIYQTIDGPVIASTSPLQWFLSSNMEQLERRDFKKTSRFELMEID